VLGLDAHAALWRGLAAAGARDWRQARSNLMTASKILGHYPPQWQARAKVALARAALELGEPASAMQALASLPQAAVSADVAAEALLVRASLELLSNKSDVALMLYQQVAGSPYRPAAVRGVLEGTLLKERLGKMKPNEAIDALERLRFQWRGDDVELRTLSELGNLYVTQGRYRDGFDTMRLAVRHFAQADAARATATKMATIFEDLFLNGKADGMKPIELALPFGLGLQAASTLYFQLDTRLAQLNIHDSDNALLIRDATPVSMTVVWNALPQLDIQGAIATDVKDAADALSFLVGLRVYTGIVK
jgi:hypothetical protein